MKTDCPFSTDVNAYVAGELPSAARLAFQGHLPGCTSCRSAISSTRRLLEKLQSLPAPECAPGLADRILAKALASKVVWDRSRRKRRGAAIAAAAAILGLCSTIHEHDHRAAQPLAESMKTDPAVAAALDWLVRTQQPDGSWDVQKWGGQPHFKAALTALPLLALATAEERTPAQKKATVLAVSSLLRQQNRDGSFGPLSTSSAYNTSIATLALLHAWQRHPEAVPKASLNAALRIVASQLGNDDIHPIGSDSACVHHWHLQALTLAVLCGWENMRPAAERAHAWLVAHDDGYIVPNTSPSGLPDFSLKKGPGGAMDYYRAYFAADIFRSWGTHSANEHLQQLQKALLQNQVKAGDSSGSWAADGFGGRAGGRLYSTSLASLALQR